MTTLGRAALVVSSGILISRVVGFLRDVVLVALLGRGLDTDLYNAAFLIPDYLFFLMAGGYLAITFVPIVSRHLAEGDAQEANRSFTAVFGVVGVVMAALTVATMMAAEPLTRTVFPALPPEAIPELADLVRIILPAQVFFVLGSLLMAVQYAHRRFLVPTLAPIIYNLAIIGGGLVAEARGDGSPAGFIWGALVGAAVGNFGLQWWGARRLGLRMVGGVGMRHPAVGEYFSLAFPLMIGQSAVALDEQFLRVFGQLGPSGDITSLQLARRLQMLPVGVIAQAAGVASYPFLARLSAEGRVAELAASLARALRGSLAAAGLATAAVVGLAVPIVQLAYQRGAFDAADTLAVAPLLAVYGLAIPLWAAHQVYTRGFYAQRRMWLPVGIGTGVTLISLPLYWVLASRFGAVGVAWASVASMALYTMAIAVAWHRQGHPAGGVGRTVARSAVAGAGAWGAAVLVSAGLTGGAPAATSAALWSLLLGTVVAAAVYVGLLALLGERWSALRR